MSQQYLSEIRVFGFGFPPKGWALCNGQLLPINQNQALFSLLGTTYGGNGTTNFALPNIQSRTMLSQGTSPISHANYMIGQAGGVENVTLLQTQMPMHNHLVGAQSSNGTTVISTTSKIAKVINSGATGEIINAYATGAVTPVPLDPRTISTVGGNVPHTNMPPYLTMNVCIALTGIFPSRN